ncbi:APC family permease [Candidatus Halobonum tyrrellensis]|uniref:Amino acid permease-associated protein n=1 Tax=Candidatus Halobonum tyrrellensis G22 TaxID=1324957 RepID=V4HPK6_9EURY|nr:APC family permease [Candidatus Halobonum tyrrellensis]ESP89824.1 amino acid permease-associated protein [Candidatus Halobonum tyrrellensis G22]
MSTENLGLKEAVSFALGGIIGGGIFAVLGVVAEIAGPTAWIAYLIAGIVVLATGYSYVTLNERSDRNGGSVTFVEEFLDRPTLAGMLGWTLIVGYVGTIAMYGYAFGAYFGAIFGLSRIPVLGVPSRPLLSALVIVGFVGLNLVGLRESGVIEDLLVALKLLVVVGFGVVGVWFGYTHDQLQYGVVEVTRTPTGPFLAAAVAFVSFEGWQLLFYDQERIENPVETLRKVVYVSIPVSTLAYVIVAFVTLSLVSGQQVVAHPDLALAIAARQFAGRVGYLAIGVAAVASTASAINATLMSTALFAKRMSSDRLIPDRVAGSQTEGVPTRALLGIGALTIGFTVYGSLQAITEFASMAFIVVFGAMNYVAVRQVEWSGPRVWIPVIGLAGTVVFLPLFCWHLYSEQFDIFVLVVGIAVALLLVEGLYFERRLVSEGVHSIRKRL